MKRWILLIAMIAMGCQTTNTALPALSGKSPTRIPPPPTGTLGSANSGYERPGDFRLGDYRNNPMSNTGLVPVTPGTGESLAPRRADASRPSAPRIASTPVRPPTDSRGLVEEGGLSWRNPGAPVIPNPQLDDSYLARQLDPETSAPPFRYRGF